MRVRWLRNVVRAFRLWYISRRAMVRDAGASLGGVCLDGLGRGREGGQGQVGLGGEDFGARAKWVKEGSVAASAAEWRRGMAGAGVAVRGGVGGLM